MELDELKKIWKKQSVSESEHYSQTELLMIINNKMSLFDEKIRWRDRLEVGAFLLCTIIFGLAFFYFQSVWAKVGCVTIILSGLLICYKLIAARRTGKEKINFYERSLYDQLQWELQKVEAQKGLLKNIMWWYLLPIFTGLVLFTIGLQNGVITKIVYLLLVMALYGYIWKSNQDEVSNNFDPTIKQLKEAINFIEESPN